MEHRIYLLYFGLAIFGLMFAGYLALVEPTGYSVADNMPPYAAFSYSPSEPFETEEIAFDASESYDSDGSIIFSEWDFGDGHTGEGMIVSHEYTFPGKYTVKLLIMDSGGKSRSTSKDVVVSAVQPASGNSRPSAILDMPSGAMTGEEIMLDAGRSHDRDGRIIKYWWTLGDGRQAEGRTVKTSYSRPGEYTVWLTVRDSNGARSSVGKIIEIG